MSLHLVDADVRYVLTALAATNNINIVIDDNVTGTVSVNLDDISPIAAMKIIGRIKGLAIEEDAAARLLTQAATKQDGLAQWQLKKSPLTEADFVINTNLHIS